MNHDAITKEHMENGGHEGRIVFLEQSFSEIQSSLGDIRGQMQVQSTQITNIVDRLNKFENPGTTKICEFHRDNLTLFRGELALHKAELESVKSKVLAWGGAITFAAVLFPFIISHLGGSSRDIRLDKMEQNQVNIFKAIEQMKKP